MNAILLALTMFAQSAAPPAESADSPAAKAADKPTVIVVVGAEGEPEYGKSFAQWADQWRQAAAAGGAGYVAIGPQAGAAAGGDDDKSRLRQALTDEPAAGPGELWIVLIGHGTFDGRAARFNLRGSDVSADELSQWLKPIQRPVAVIDCASSSAPFINKLSAANRVIVTATKSGFEMNYARFGGEMAAAIADVEADLDKDGQTSLLEAYLWASRRVAEFYQLEGRLATEHALLDDNGDAKGTPADWFRGIRAVRKAQDGATRDGLRAHQFHLVRSQRERQMPPALRARRDELEVDIAQLRDAKSTMPEDDYYNKLEPLVVELARLYEQADKP